MHLEELLDRLREKYSTCETYQDTGRVDGPYSSILFQTFFVRPLKFRFDWVEGAAKNSIWTDESKVFAMFSFNDNVEEETSLSYAIAGATGVSQRAAHTIPTMLMPDIEAAVNSRTLIKQFDCVDATCMDETVEGRELFKVCITRPNQVDELWVRSEDLAVVRIKEEHTSTTEDDEVLLQSIREFDAEHAEGMRLFLASQSPEARHSVTTTLYQEILFDKYIDNAVFSSRR